MSEYMPDRRPGTPSWGAARVVLSVVGLFLVAIVAFSYVSSYRSAVDGDDSGTSEEATGSVEATEAAGASEGSADEQATDETGDATPESPTRYVVVVIPGLNFRMEPKSGAEVIRTLPEGTRLVLLGEQNGWYQVRDDDDVTGWVSSSSDYVTLEDE